LLPQKTSLGRYGIEVTDGKGGALVRRVSPDASAVHELEVGDVIVAVSGTTVGSAKDAERLLAGPAPLLLRIWRNDAFRFAILDRN